MRVTQWIGVFGVIVLLFGGFVTPSWAADVHTGGDYRLEEGRTIGEDLFVAAETVTLSGRVNGDVTAASGNVVMRGEVSEDVNVAGGSVNILGRVGDDVRAAGGNVIIADDVGGNVAVAGGSVHLLSGSVVEGDVIVGSGSVILDGMVNGSVKAWGGRVRLNGMVREGADVTSSESVVIGRGAVIEGDLVYRAPQAILIEDGARVAGRVVREPLPEPMRDGGFWRNAKDAFVAASLVQLLALLGAGLLGVLLFREGSQALLSAIGVRPWRSLAIGFAVLVVVPVLVFVLFLTLVGFFAALLLLFLYFVFLLISYIYAGILLGTWLFKVYSRKKDLEVNWGSALTGIVLLFVIGFIPIVGWIIAFVLFLMVLGGLTEKASMSLGRRTSTPQPLV
jgi:cytoskeletal protein CcmA (bactofilin family)